MRCSSSSRTLPSVWPSSSVSELGAVDVGAVDAKCASEDPSGLLPLASCAKTAARKAWARVTRGEGMGFGAGIARLALAPAHQRAKSGLNHAQHGGTYVMSEQVLCFQA